MESDISPTATDLINCYNCKSSCTVNRSLSGTYLRSVKRKIDDLEEKSQFTVPGLVIQQNARVDSENECRALREMVGSQQLTIQDLITDLEEERNASASSANEAMSMILRLQREKADIQMEARQFKRFAEEKMAHDQHEISALEDLLYKREQAIQSLSREVQAYKHRMMSFGLAEADVDGGSIGGKAISRNTSISENLHGQLESPREIYPRLKCNTNESQISNDDEDEAAGVEIYEDSPYSRDQLKDLDFRINQLEQSPRTIEPDEEQFSSKNVHEKIIVGHTPKQPRYSRMFSSESLRSPAAIVKEMRVDIQPDSPQLNSRVRKSDWSRFDMNTNQKTMDSLSEDDTSDRVYTIDSIHQGASGDDAMNCRTPVGISDDYFIPRDSDVHDLEIQKLYARLHALEADRETMRQTIISMGTDKAQLVLLKEIAQKLCKDMSSSGQIQTHKENTGRRLSSMPMLKWITSIVQWRNKACKYRCISGLSDNSAGLQMLLDRSPRPKLSRLVSRTNL